MISSIHVRNIRSLTDARLELSDRVTLALGENGAGKSTLAAAIQYALCGWCEWTDKKGAGYADLISHGEKQASIDLATGVGVVMRTLTPKGARLSVDERTGKDAEAILSAKLPDRDLVASMLSSGQFISLSAKEQQDVLFQLAGGQANAEWFAGKLTEPEREVLASDLATRLTGSALTDVLHKTAFDTRREANRQVKQLEGQATGEAVEVPADAQARENKLGQAVMKARQDLAAAQEALGKARADHEAIAQAKRRAEAAREAYQKAEAALEALGEQPDHPGQAAVAKADLAIDNAIRARAEINNELRAADGKLAALKAQAERVAKLDGKCIIAGVDCPLSEGELEKLRADVQAQVAEAETQCRALGKRLTKAEQAEEEARKVCLEQQEQANAHAEWRERFDALAMRKHEAQAHLDEANADAQRSFTPLPAAQATVQEAQTKLDKLEAEHRELSRLMDAASSHKRVQRQLAEAKARAAMLNELVGKLAPDGLPAQAMRETVGTVLDAVNETLSQFTDFTLKLDGADLNVIRAGDRTALHLLSESEKLRVGAAIQVAFAKLTKFGFVIVDAADRLDTDNRPALLKMLLKSGVQALVTATPMNGTRPQAPGLAVYDLADGRAVDARRVEEAAA